MTEMWLYQPEGFDCSTAVDKWERYPTDLSTAVEQWWESVDMDERTDETQVFVEMSCCKIPMPHLDWWLEQVAEDICDDTFLEHEDYEVIEKIMEHPDVVAAGQTLWDLIHSKIDFWQADKVVRKVTIRAWWTDREIGAWDWGIIGDWEVVE